MNKKILLLGNNACTLESPINKDIKENKVQTSINAALETYDPTSEKSILEIKAITDELKLLGKSLDVDCDKKIDKFFNDYINIKLGYNSQSLKEHHYAGYEEIKNNLIKVLEILNKSSHRSNSFKQHIYINLISQLEVCGPGIAYSVSAIIKELNTKVSVANWLARLRLMIVREIADKMTAHFYPDAPGMSIHMDKSCEEYANKISKLNVSSLDDASNVRDEFKIEMVPTATTRREELAKIREKQLYFNARFVELYTPQRMIDGLTKDFTEHFYRSCEEFQNDKSQTTDYKNFTSLLNKLFGMLETPAPLSRLLIDDVSEIKDDVNNKNNPSSIKIMNFLNNEKIGIISKADFYKLIRSYIISYMITQDIIAGEVNITESLKNGDTLQIINDDEEHSWIKTKVNKDGDYNIYSYKGYIAENMTNISNNIRLRFQISVIKDLIDKLDAASKAYEVPAEPSILSRLFNFVFESTIESYNARKNPQEGISYKLMFWFWTFMQGLFELIGTVILSSIPLLLSSIVLLSYVVAAPFVFAFIFYFEMKDAILNQRHAPMRFIEVLVFPLVFLLAYPLALVYSTIILPFKFLYDQFKVKQCRLELIAGVKDAKTKLTALESEKNDNKMANDAKELMTNLESLSDTIKRIPNNVFTLEEDKKLDTKVLACVESIKKELKEIVPLVVEPEIKFTPIQQHLNITSSIATEPPAYHNDNMPSTRHVGIYSAQSHLASKKLDNLDNKEYKYKNNAKN